MKNNLVKIVATLGLIIVIAVILKSVFGIGKIGVKNLSSKTYIKFDKCYPLPDEFTNYTSFNEWFVSIDNEWDEAFYEIDLEKNEVVTTDIRSDESIKEAKERHNIVISKIRIETYPIISSSNTFIRTAYAKPKSNHVDLGQEYAYVFNLKEGYFEINTRNSDTQRIVSTSMSKCEKIK